MRHADSVEVPVAVTQDGIAEATGVGVRHVLQYLRPLLREGLVRERMAHVAEGRQRRKAYGLTDAGRLAAIRLRDRARAEIIRVRDAQGLREVPVGEALAAAPGIALLSVVRAAAKGGIVDLAALAAPAPAAFLEMTRDAPRVERFVGRQAELRAIVSEDSRSRVFVVRGVAGIGKSSLGAKACEGLRGRANLFWHALRPWDTRSSVLASLGEYLSAMGRPGLRSVLVRGETDRAVDVLREDLQGTKAFLVFDDAHEASAEAISLLRLLKDVVSESPDVRILVLTRRTLPFYDRRDVSIRGIVREIDLAGLSAEEAASLLATDRAPGASTLSRRLGGHPLFLELVRTSARDAVRGSALRDVHRFIEEEIYRELTEPERGVLKIASLYRVPVPRDALLAGPEASHDAVLSATNRALLRSTGEGDFEVHDTVRDFFEGVLTPTERDRLGAFAARSLRILADRAQREGRSVEAIRYVSNALRLSVPSETRAVLWELLADLQERTGNLPDALTSYKEAARFVEDPETRARIHRKTALALEIRGQIGPASGEVEAGWALLEDAQGQERGWLDLAAARIAASREDWPAARERAESALRTLRAHGDVAGQTRALMVLGNIEIDASDGDSPRGEERFRTALRLAEPLGDPDLFAQIHTGIAHLLAYRRGDAEGALRHIELADAVPRASEDLHARRARLMLRGWFHLELRADIATARTFFMDAAHLGRRIHSPATVTYAGYGLALCTYYEGHLPEARIAFEGFANDILAQGVPSYAVEGKWMVAECALRQGDVPGFEKIVADLKDIAYAAGVQARPIHMRVLRALSHLLHGDRAGGLASFEEALRLAEGGPAMQDANLAHFVHHLLGCTLRALGQQREADEHIERAIEFLRSHHQEARLRILPALGEEILQTLRKALGASSPNRSAAAGP